MSEINEKFIKQAQELAAEAEVLPGGVMELAKKLQKADEEKRPLRVKLGLDPTRPDLHLGHTVVMRKLKKFQDLGHKIVLIVGGATAMVGDPSGKSETRPNLTKEQVETNAKTYFEQMSKVVDVEKAEVINNADWLHPLTLVELLKLASSTTVAQMMARDDFAKRYSKGLPISVHEFMYPLMQSYDSVAIEADIELGGSDQRFNLLLGREVQTFYGKKDPQLAFLLPLIEGTDGVVKMSKTYPEHCISLTDSPNTMYGKLMSIPDELILRYYKLLTDLKQEQIVEIEKRLKGGENPRNIKMELAHLLTKLYSSTEQAASAQEEFINVVQNKGIPEDIPTLKLEAPKNILDLLIENNLIASKGEGKRLMQGGGVKFENEKITDPLFVVEKSGVLQAGKRKFLKVEV